ncbi:aldo/keto reductase [Candidatus Poribacteria bacterium]|nr:aldo/keto reductase [Candidatus Poribacteria bacterium]
MQYKEYGTTGDKVSRLGYGLMRLPMEGDHVDMDLSVELIRKAIELGVNYLDSAVMYCNAESQVAFGKGIKGLRDKVFVSTKNHYKGESGDDWQKHLDDSLERIDVDYIDFYHLHGLSWDQFQNMQGKGGPIERFRKAQDEGLIRHRCFSCHDNPENMKKLIDTGEFAGMLVQYNLLDRKNEEAIAHACENGMGVAIMGPVGGGRLVAPSDTIQEAVGASSTPEVALRFVLSNPNVTLALSGMNSIQMIEENVATASREEALADDEKQKVMDMLEETKKLSDLYCTGCGYCMPCPNDIDIPANFSAMNYYKVWGLKEHAQVQYKRLGKKKLSDGKIVEAWAEACIECGECEPKCPQDIPIREQLKETAEALGS